MQAKLTPWPITAAAIVAVLSVLLAGCNKADDPSASTTAAGEYLLASSQTTMESPAPAGEAQPPDANVHADLYSLLDANSIRIGMNKAQLVDVFAPVPSAELIELTLHGAALSVLLIASDTAQMMFMLHDDYLALAVELRTGQAEELWAMDEEAEEAYGRKSSFPPRELREWAAENDYFDDDELSLYLHVEDAVARNIWHESDFNASFRQPKDQGDYFWFMLAGQQPAEPDARTDALYGVIDPHGLPDDMEETAEDLQAYLQNFRHSVADAWNAIF